MITVLNLKESLMMTFPVSIESFEYISNCSTWGKTNYDSVGILRLFFLCISLLHPKGLRVFTTNTSLLFPITAYSSQVMKKMVLCTLVSGWDMLRILNTLSLCAVITSHQRLVVDPYVSRLLKRIEYAFISIGYLVFNILNWWPTLLKPNVGSFSYLLLSGLMNEALLTPHFPCYY